MVEIKTHLGKFPWRCYHGVVDIRPEYDWPEGCVKTESLENSLPDQQEAEVLVWLRPEAPEPKNMRVPRAVNEREVEEVRAFWKQVNDERSAAEAGEGDQTQPWSKETILARLEFPLTDIRSRFGAEKADELKSRIEQAIDALFANQGSPKGGDQ